jgi:EmrB/QacA subfamily drug resistance transporter
VQRRWWILAIVSTAQLMIVLDSTVMNIALPSAQRDLGFSTDVRQWIVTAYALAFGSLLLLGGRLSDLFGRKITFLIGVAGFAVASAFGGAAVNFEMLVAARALQGMFGALLAPSALSLLTTTFGDSKDRGKAFGVFGAIVGAGAAIGLLLGGLLTEYLDWRWCLYVNLFFAVFVLAGGAALLAAGRADERPRMDLPGALTSVGGLFCVVYGLSNAETHAWRAPSTWGYLAAGAVLLAGFVMLEARSTHPLLPLRIVADRNRGGSYLAVFITGAGMFGVFLFLTYYMQNLRGYSPVKTGLAFLPMVAAIMITAQVSNITLLPRIGPKIPVAAGMILGAAGMAWLTGIGLHSSYTANVLPQLIIVGLGMGLIMAPAMNVATDRVEAGDAGVASAMVNTGQQVGGSIGTALLSSLAASAVTDYLKGKQPTALVTAEAALHSYTTAFWWSAGIFAVGAVVCGLLLRRGVLAPQPDEEVADRVVPAAF